jgi:hypothetical protein
MSLVLFNPTNETLMAQYVGEDVIIAPYPEHGHKVKVDDARGRHILNALGPRGLMSLEYGDDEDAKREIGLARNREFKKKQIIRYNQENERRKQAGMAYLEPTPQVAEYARELGVALLEPYALKDPEKAEVSRLKDENRGLHTELTKLSEKFNTVMQDLATGKVGGNEATMALQRENVELKAQINDMAGKLDKLVSAMTGAKAATEETAEPLEEEAKPDKKGKK